MAQNSPLKKSQNVKKILLLSTLIIGMMIACNNGGHVPQTQTVQNDSFRTVEPNFFYLCADTVKTGYTAWGRSKIYFGNGENWRMVIAKNPILQQAGRVYQDTVTGIWYAMMHPGEILNMNDTTHLKPVFTDTLQKVIPPPFVMGVPKDDLDFWKGFCFILVIILIFLVFFWEHIKPKKNKENENPVTAGTPQVPGGINDNGAQNRINEIAREQYGNTANIVVRNIRRGRLSGSATVFYADKPNGEKRTFENVIGYAGEITVDGKEQTVYFLQGCGNDVRRGNYMKDLTFTPDVEILVLDEVVKPITSQLVKTTVSEHSETESTTPLMKTLNIIEKHINDNANQKSKLVLNLDTNGKLEFTVDYRYKDNKQPLKKDEVPKTGN